MITYLHGLFGNDENPVECNALGCCRTARFVVESAVLCRRCMRQYNKGESVPCEVSAVAGGDPNSPSLIIQPVLLKREPLFPDNPSPTKGARRC